MLHKRHLTGADGFLERAIFLLGSFQDVELLGVGEFVVVESVLDLGLDLHHRTAFRLLHLLGDLLL